MKPINAADIFGPRARSLLIVAFAMIGGTAGCVPPLSDGMPDEPDAIADDDAVSGPASLFAFDEDEDPEIAALPYTEDELLLRVLPGAKAVDLNEAYAAADVTVVETIQEIDTVAVRVERDRFMDAAAALAGNPLFESVHKSYLYDAEALPQDRDFSRQNHFAPIGVDKAWDITTGSPDLIIAVLDTGVDPEHPDLVDRLLDGWNAFDKNDDFADVLGHGTAVAGSAAAVTDNADGVAGVTWDNPILPVRVSDATGRAASKDIASGITWAVQNGARVINVSFAPLGSDRTVLAAAQWARNHGALVFISTGNNGKYYRSRQTDQAIFIGAVDTPDVLAEFSNTGEFVDLVAPGVGVYTTKRGGGYGPVSGTSFASPITAGVAALVWSINPDFRPATVRQLLLDTAVDLGSDGRDDEFGAGRVAAAEAVDAALDAIETPDTQSPTVEVLDPDDQQKVSKVINVAISAFDAGDLADVVLTVDGDPFATDTSKPYKFAINTKDLTNGTHTLVAQATDLAGNSQSSPSVRIVVEGGRTSAASGGGSSSGGSSGPSSTSDPAASDTAAPTLNFTFPADRTRVFGSVGVQAEVADDAGLAAAEWLVNGVRQRVDALTGTTDTISFLWQADGAPSGNHTITLRIRDEAGNVSASGLNLIKN